MKSSVKRLPSARWAPDARSLSLLAALAIMLTILSVGTEFFMTPQNLAVVALQASTVLILAMGMTMLMISGNIDLSIGSSFAFSGVIAAMLSQVLPVPVALVAGILGSAVVGLVNGLLVWRLKINP